MTDLLSKMEPWRALPGQPSLQFRYHVATDIGTARSNNEDNFLVKPDIGLFAVADGMGGHAGGEVASWITSDRMGRVLEELAVGHYFDLDFLFKVIPRIDSLIRQVIKFTEAGDALQETPDGNRFTLKPGKYMISAEVPE